MVSSNKIFEEMTESKDPHAFKKTRLKYLERLQQYTGRGVVLYSANWLGNIDSEPELQSLDDADLQDMVEVIDDLGQDSFDLILHSPGGSVEAVEALVKYIRYAVKDLRVIVPHMAMSAATMLACAADIIVMGKQSSLGPIDPQITMKTPTGVRYVPARAIIKEFREVARHLKSNPGSILWTPIVAQYHPGLITHCNDAIGLSQKLVSKWLSAYMFKSEKSNTMAKKISNYLSKYDGFHSHMRHIDVDTARQHGLKIQTLESDETLRDLVMSIHRATMITFDRTPTVKIIENSNGYTFARRASP